MAFRTDWARRLFFAVMACFAASEVQAGSVPVVLLHIFGSGSDGDDPGQIVLGSDGNFYGTTQYGGANEGGVIFTVTASGTETVLYSFPARSTPSSLILGSDGAFYGTTEHGGANICTDPDFADGLHTIGCGSFFRMSPDDHVVTTIYSFGATATDAIFPEDVIEGSDGNIYGTAPAGGQNGRGAVFRIDADGSETLLRSFGPGRADGSSPSKLVQGSDGMLYGVAPVGGFATYCSVSSGCGVIYQLSTAGAFRIVYAFSAVAYGGIFPHSRLHIDGSGNFYGTTAYGNGTSDQGSVFKIAPDGTVLFVHGFVGGASDGALPYNAGLTPNSSGNFYGTTELGGSTCRGQGCGTIFEITPEGVTTIIHSFGPEAEFPNYELVQGPDGNFYGTTSYGTGTTDIGGVGTFFRLQLTPGLEFSASTSSIPVGDPLSLTWSVSNAKKCEASRGWSGRKSYVDGNYSETVTATAASNIYVLTCTNLHGSTRQTVKVTGSTAPSLPPSLDFTTPDSDVVVGAETALNWSVAGASSCAASGSWSGIQASADGAHFATVTPTVGSNTYTLACTNATGTTTKSVQITASAAPSLTLSSSATTVTIGMSVNLSWTVRGAANCSASGAWNGAKVSADGSHMATVMPAAPNSTYRLACTNSSGTTTRSVQVAGTPPTSGPGLPTLSLVASAATVTIGTPVALSWTVTGADSCLASGAWSGALASNDGTHSASVTPGSADNTYSLSCTNSVGSTTRSTRVTGTPVAPGSTPALTLTASADSVSLGSSATLTWTVSGASSCTASGSWNGARSSTDGTNSAQVTVSSATSTYILSCANSAGATVKSVQVVGVSSSAGKDGGGGAFSPWLSLFALGMAIWRRTMAYRSSDF